MWQRLMRCVVAVLVIGASGCKEEVVEDPPPQKSFQERQAEKDALKLVRHDAALEQIQKEVAEGKLISLNRFSSTTKQIDRLKPVAVNGMPIAEYYQSHRTRLADTLTERWDSLPDDLADVDDEMYEETAGAVGEYLGGMKAEEWKTDVYPNLKKSHQAKEKAETSLSLQVFAKRSDVPHPPAGADPTTYVAIAVFRDDAAFGEADFNKSVTDLENRIFAWVKKGCDPIPVYAVVLKPGEKRPPNYIRVRFHSYYDVYRHVMASSTASKPWGDDAYMNRVTVDFSARGTPAKRLKLYDVTETKSAPSAAEYERLGRSVHQQRRHDMATFCENLATKIESQDVRK